MDIMIDSNNMSAFQPALSMGDVCVEQSLAERINDALERLRWLREEHAKAMQLHARLSGLLCTELERNKIQVRLARLHESAQFWHWILSELISANQSDVRFRKRLS